MNTKACWNEIGAWGSRSCPELAQAVHCRNCPTYAGAAVALLDRALPQGYREDAAGRFALSVRPESRGDASAVVFRVGAEWLALATTVFREVCEVRPVHSLPHQRGGVVTGIANIRGELLVCVSIAAQLGIEESGTLEATAEIRGAERMLVAGVDGQRLVFRVNEIHGVHRFDRSQLREAPATVGRAASTYTRAMLSWRGKAVGLLDHELLFNSLSRSMS